MDLPVAASTPVRARSPSTCDIRTVSTFGHSAHEVALQPVLPEDVLLEVLAASDLPNAARMMRVSRFLYAEGPKVVLQEPITIDTNLLLRQLLVFLRVGGQRRMRFVRTLSVSIYQADEHNFQCLLHAIRHMSNLHSLSFAVHSEDQLLRFLSMETTRLKLDQINVLDVLRSFSILFRPEITPGTSHRLVLALLHMVNLHRLYLPGIENLLQSWDTDLPLPFLTGPLLRDLQMYSVGELGLTMLKGLRAPLVSICLNFTTDDATDTVFDRVEDADLLPLHPVELLSYAQHSLEKLEAYGWYTHPFIPPNRDIVYPKMSVLTLERAEMPITMSYIRAYPNLTLLRHRTLEADMSNFNDNARRRHDHRHRFNVSQQLESGLTWTQMQNFDGSVLDLYLLGLTCQIDCVSLYDIRSDLRYQLGPVLSYARPRRLHLDGSPGDLSGPAEETFALLRGEGCSRLESLTLTVNLDDTDQNPDMSALLESLRHSLAHTRLQELSVDVRLSPLAMILRQSSQALETCERAPDGLPPQGRTDPDDYPLCLAERNAARFDLEGYMHSLTDTIPTLCKASVHLSGLGGRYQCVALDPSGQVRYGDFEEPSWCRRT
ncbi:hypothetical protein BN946_scf185044.g3 [Trametes cinnabarina]|uniref:F-box domain-containing protein n=1 Tax=Pycnoporus cinnabarinus TaxID=5643 RepID=A0A060S1D4_PYCCI|nr:hypothetical protein BN946_scf185044.g3 [Trametes cinnabarina]